MPFSLFSKPTSSKLTPDLIKSYAKNYLTGYLSTKSDSLFGKVGIPKDTTELENNAKIRITLNKLINMAVNEYVDSELHNDKDLQEYVNLKSSNQQPNQQHSIETGLIVFINKTDVPVNTDNTVHPVNAVNNVKYQLIIDRIKEVDAAVLKSKGGKRKSMRNRKSKRTKNSKKNRRRTNRRH